MDGALNTLSTSLELNINEFSQKCQNINKAIGIKITSNLSMKHQMKLFLANYDHFFTWSCAYFYPLFGWTPAHLYQKVRAEVLYFKIWKYKQNNLNTINLTLVGHAAIGAFLENLTIFLATDKFILIPCLDRTVHAYVTS